MTRIRRPERSLDDQMPAFFCGHCRRVIPSQVAGTEHRNHCPFCLWSLHVDLRTGDRRSGCRGEMEPVAVSVKRDGEWSLVHRCTTCGWVRINRIAGDDNEWLLLSLAMRPLARPPFPLERLDGRWEGADHEQA